MSRASATVVVPTRDRSQLVGDTVTSVLAQRDVDVELVVVDDGSGAEQAAALTELVGDRGILIRNERSRGAAAARNQGAAAATTPWVAFCDDDDLWTAEKLRGQLEALASRPAGWAYSGAVKFSAGPTVWQVMPAPSPEAVAARLADQCIIPAGASNVVVSTQLLRDTGGWDERLRHLADWDLWLRLLEREPPSAVADISVAYRLHPSSMSRRPAGILDELTLLDSRWRHLRGGRPLDATPTHLWIAMSYLREGDRPRAALAYLRAARRDPRRGLRGLLRTLHPDPPRPAHVVDDSQPGGSRLKRTVQVSLPETMRALLDEMAGEAPGGRRHP